VLAVPLLLIGLLRSEVEPILQTPGALIEGNFALYALLKYLVFGRWLPSGGYDVFLDPVAFGAWAALFITGLNLTPAGQLDGGHVAYALLGNNARWLSRLMVVAAIGLSLFWSGWWMFAVILVLLGQRHAEPLDDMTPLRGREKVLAVAVLLLFLLLFTAVPITVF
jgi:membrane-associated protease RseP (regulator of RpoE activity)